MLLIPLLTTMFWRRCSLNSYRNIISLTSLLRRLLSDSILFKLYLQNFKRYHFYHSCYSHLRLPLWRLRLVHASLLRPESLLLSCDDVARPNKRRNKFNCLPSSKFEYFGLFWFLHSSSLENTYCKMEKSLTLVQVIFLIFNRSASMGNVDWSNFGLVKIC